MSAQVTLSDSEREAVIAYHQANIDALKMQVAELNEQIAAANYRISELAFEVNRYNTNQPLWKKVQYILTVEKYVLSTREIARAIVALDGYDSNDPRNVKDLVSAISATLKPKIDKKDTFGRTEIDGEHYYGLIEWFNEDGSIIGEYLTPL